jgi:hypothetical protein
MELEQEGTTPKHKPSESVSSTISSINGSRPSTVAGSEGKGRAMEHDSLVTVRLSEPPTLYVNTTSLPSSSLPSRKSLYGNEYTPSDVMAESVKEEEEDDNNSVSEEEYDTMTPASAAGRTLQDELEQTDPDEGQEQEQETEEDDEKETTPEPDTRQSSGSEVVNWDKLEKTEEQESDNVCGPHFTDCLGDAKLVSFSMLTASSHSLQHSYLPSWSRRTTRSLRTRRASRLRW